MGGLYGFVNKKNLFDSRSLIIKMRNSLTHQDWHSDEMIIEKNYAFGRKGVVPSQFQPVYSEEKKCFIMLDGDIFSIKNIGEEYDNTYSLQIVKDILDLYRNSPPDTPEKLDGDFNVLIADVTAERFTLINDIFGLRYLFYYNDPNIFIFAPEIEAILQYHGVNRELNYGSISDYFYFRTMIMNNTFFNHINLMPPASILKVNSRHEIELKRYWYPNYQEDRENVNYDDFIEEGYELWKNAIHKRIKGKKKIAIPLTGGLDSRLLVAFTLMKNDNIYTFTHGDKGIDEHRIAKEVVKRLCLPNYRLYEFSGDSLAKNIEEAVRLKGGMTPYGSLLLEPAKEFSNNYDVYLNGSFAMGLSFTTHYFKEDEINKRFIEQEKIKRISERCGEKYFGHLVQKQLSNEFLSQIIMFKGNNIKEGLREFEDYSDSFHKEKDLFLIQTLKRRAGVGIDTWRYFVNDVLPLADYDLFEFYLRFPSKYKINREFHFDIIRKKFPELAAIEYQRTGVNLFSKPGNITIFQRTKIPLIKYYIGRLSHGKVNIIDKTTWDNGDIWYRKSKKLQDFIQDILLDETTRKRGFYNINQIERLLKKEKEGGQYFKTILMLAEFEIANRIFF